MAQAQGFTATQDIAAVYARDGFVVPIDVMSPAEAQALRDDLEAAQAELAGDAEKLELLRLYPNQLLPSFSALTRHENVIAAASAVLGPDLMVWGADLFIKEPKTDKIVSWHQDLTYWGLDDAEEATCWVALSPATNESGCMRFVPGTHKTLIVAHTDTYAEDNLLSRGQEIAVEVNESDAVVAALKPGQASIHHGHLFHASGPNTTADRRIGCAIRFIKPEMKQETGDKSLVSLVAGEDRFGHFNVAPPPKDRLTEEDFARCRTDKALKNKLLME